MGLPAGQAGCIPLVKGVKTPMRRWNRVLTPFTFFGFVASVPAEASIIVAKLIGSG